ncbi:unnamed protein product, partial [marine sediment metagenome]
LTELQNQGVNFRLRNLYELRPPNPIACHKAEEPGEGNAYDGLNSG